MITFAVFSMRVVSLKEEMYRTQRTKTLVHSELCLVRLSEYPEEFYHLNEGNAYKVE